MVEKFKHLALPRRLRIAAPLLAILVLLFSSPRNAAAHPLGNFSVNTYSRLEVAAGEIRLLYIVDMAEIPAFQERPRIDGNADETISPAEQERYLTQEAARLQRHLSLLIDGRPAELQLVQQALEFPPGQGSLNTQRITLHLAAAVAPQPDPWQASYTDGNFPGRPGWREIIVWAGDGVTLLESSAPAQDVSQELRQYPQDLLQSPLAAHDATFRFAPAGTGEQETADQATARQSGLAGSAADQNRFSQDRFAELIRLPLLGPGALLLALLAAFGWGAAHAFTPGHGKTIVAAYLVGSRGTARHALFLGLTTTITHTLGVFVLGFVVLFASRFILPETLYPWLGVVSGILVVSIGLSLFGQRLRHSLQPASAQSSHHHSHGPGHFHPPHDHTHDHHHHDHHHPHDHHHHAHDYGHSHLPPETGPVTWRSLLALGISGGLLPCPSALVMMLGAIALQRVGLGLALILAFSVGLASVLTAVGIVMVYAGRLFERIPVSPGRSHLARAVPVFSALVITIAGIGITLRAFLETGILS
ncbi:MAG: sulfite exporter TauE/SafE family protein [Chloroflexi bacterium]|nr:sulfite exporter TauE/SafE family protein [Chloroflexota bacterium]MCI0579333.1 sulfite exporter TauE/SafE family protein [Chloroflexota bacterium]MCI0644976.1 sulfite exporter TauE/SafE family protein [Chloroflexota bacterium]MCI0727855.1 sulfite exporter TauE/SafE family protein [Chloroflexota bacterium]